MDWRVRVWERASRSILDLYILLVAAAETTISYESRKLCELTVFRHAVST